jgi:hypothetical protein
MKMTNIHEIDVENEEELVAYQMDLIRRVQEGIQEVIMDETECDSGDGWLDGRGLGSPCDYDVTAIAVAFVDVMNHFHGLREAVEDCMKAKPPTKTKAA